MQQCEKTTILIWTQNWKLSTPMGYSFLIYQFAKSASFKQISRFAYLRMIPHFRDSHIKKFNHLVKWSCSRFWDVIALSHSFTSFKFQNAVKFSVFTTPHFLSMFIQSCECPTLILSTQLLLFINLIGLIVLWAGKVQALIYHSIFNW